MEYAISVDAMEPFAKACYAFRGDGTLDLVVCEHISMLYSAILTEHYSNAAAVANNLAGSEKAIQRQLNEIVAYAKASIQQAYDYFLAKFNKDLQPALSGFKAAPYFSPIKICEIKPHATDIESLHVLSFLNDSKVIDGLKSELANYLPSAEDVWDNIDLVEW